MPIGTRVPQIDYPALRKARSEYRARLIAKGVPARSQKIERLIDQKFAYARY